MLKYNIKVKLVVNSNVSQRLGTQVLEYLHFNFKFDLIFLLSKHPIWFKYR